MSRVGKQPVKLPSGVTFKAAGTEVVVAGPKGTNKMRVPPGTQFSYDDAAKAVKVARLNDTKQARANHGLARSLLSNMVKGVATGFERRLQIYGTGYNCKLQGKMLHLNVGFSGRRRGIGSQFELAVPEGL